MIVHRKMIALLLAGVVLLFTTAFSEGGEPMTSEAPSVCRVEGPLDWQAFSEATSRMVREYAGKVVLDSDDNAFHSGRLIAKINGDLPDIATYHPVRVIRDTEDHFLIQFLSAREAEDCMLFLDQQDAVEYVEPDISVSIDTVPADDIH